MLTRLSHQTARHFTNPADRDAYRLHMCGLCHALGDDYGLPSRLLTRHELILLNLLISAQTVEAPQEVERRCPLNPLKTVYTNQDAASQIAADAAVLLADASFADDLVDSDGHDLVALGARLLLRRARTQAKDRLDRSGFDSAQMAGLTATQMRAEADEGADPAEPSAAVSAALFALTAKLAAKPVNTASLAKIGSDFGRFIYLWDAYGDFTQDMADEQFNALRDYAIVEGSGFRLSREGVTWLHDELRGILRRIEAGLVTIQVYRYQGLLRRLLTENIKRAIGQLEKVLRDDKPIMLRRLNWQDVLKAGLFIAPPAAAGLGLFAIQTGDGFEGKKKRRQRSGPCDCSDDICMYTDCSACSESDCSGCGDSDGDGICNACDNVDGSGCDGPGDCDCGGCDVGNCDLSGCDCN